MILRFFHRPPPLPPITSMGLPAGGFRTILADPPWRYLNWSGAKHVPGRTEGDPYPTMTFEELAALPVADLAAKDCTLIMWAIDSHIDQAIALAARWGFKYSTRVFVWVKTSKHTGKPVMGMGKWSRKESEEAFLFTRGKPRRRPGGGGVRQLIFAPRREHSRKPEEQFARIERLSEGPYLEMFGRQRRPGWTTWGNQPDRFEAAA